MKKIKLVKKTNPIAPERSADEWLAALADECTQARWLLRQAQPYLLDAPQSLRGEIQDFLST
jgi:hypothetical protein